MKLAYRAAALAVALLSLGAARAQAQQPLRVCADPGYLPFSDQAGAGFENKVAQVLARDMGRSLQYILASERMRGGFDQFVQDTLDAKKCDVLIDVPYADYNVLTTRPYYISSYVFVFKKSANYDITSMDSPVLRHLKIGYEAETPVEGGLKMRDLIIGALPFTVADRPGVSPAIMLQAVESGKIDVGMTWDPAIAYYLRKYPDLKIVTIPNSRSQGSPEQYTFPMSMGVRIGDTQLHNELNAVIAQHRNDFAAVLREYGIRFFTPET